MESSDKGIQFIKEYFTKKHETDLNALNKVLGVTEDMEEIRKHLEPLMIKGNAFFDRDTGILNVITGEEGDEKVDKIHVRGESNLAFVLGLEDEVEARKKRGAVFPAKK